ncbi:hypothetical protein R1flu_010411 [Riccia fluitans]|uniref:Protein EXORDIUM-like 2 n=1 Tax=Riccia fluitans TaxID=41844 RepID=A0ABD1Z4X6_9MARC
MDSRVMRLFSIVLLGFGTFVQAGVVNGENSMKTAFLGPHSQVHRPSRATAGEFRLVPDPILILDYHNGPVMTGKEDAIKLFVVYYGDFAPKQRLTLRQFFKSFWRRRTQWPASHPTVEKWWQITRLYVDMYATPVARSMTPAGEIFNRYSLGKSLNQSNIQDLVVKSFGTFGVDARSMYLVLTSADVEVESFCNNVCGTHYYTFPSDTTSSQMVPYGWVGNAATQCPSMCSWPYASGGNLQTPLVAPNGDEGIDGMIITIANILAGMATNPYGNGFYQGDASIPLEAAGACQGVYGPGAFPGYPGELLVDNSTGASFNVYGAKNFKFLVPWIWHPTTLQCAGQV